MKTNLAQLSRYLDPGSAGQLGDPLPTHGRGPTAVSPLHMESGKDPLCRADSAAVLRAISHGAEGVSEQGQAVKSGVQ